MKLGMLYNVGDQASSTRRQLYLRLNLILVRYSRTKYVIPSQKNQIVSFYRAKYLNFVTTS